MKTYKIYHIPGYKIGCTQLTITERANQQGYSNVELLEEYTDGWLAGDRELELQKQYGYKVDNCHYMISLQHRSDMGKSGGNTTGRIKKNGAFHQSEIQKELSSRRKSFGPGHNFNNEERSKGHEHLNSFKNKRILCPHCQEPQNTGNYARWHGEKCKKRNLN